MKNEYVTDVIGKHTRIFNSRNPTLKNPPIEMVDTFKREILMFFDLFPLGVPGLEEDLRSGELDWFKKCSMFHFEQNYTFEKQPNTRAGFIIERSIHIKAWTTMIAAGDKPEDNLAVKLLLDWIDEWKLMREINNPTQFNWGKIVYND